MKTISVAAPCNGSGKTSLILAILQAFPKTFAVTKFTTIYREEQFCPAKDHDCACHRLQGDYLICSDPTILSQPDTDTGKIWRAGALQTLWCVSRPEGYAAMTQDYHARYLKPDIPLLMEGNTIVRNLTPHLRFFVVNPELPVSWWKNDTDEQLNAADLVLVNSYPVLKEGPVAAGPSPVAEVLDRVRQKCISMEISRRLDQWQDGRIYQAITELLVRAA